MFPESGWQEQEGCTEISGKAVNWEELTASRPEDEIVPGTDNLDAERTIGGLAPEDRDVLKESPHRNSP
ncbi:hypothetical protein G5B47_20730 [Paenibacillus sp. 7124]|uniref:Uncharacterized protein n=1 Tax=Paenibacillus apii TaxID=1850370 RepID=A0A6M1PNJ3_9BACL|nr:hypothetical protein [Paenibacillus apii]NGM84830.1 hypothetical protein [Paenibacillus apii]NJJ41916.1 hypothetical protein [Paenibacillus apii]